MNKLSIIIPAYNEKNTIEELIRRVKVVDLPAGRHGLGNVEKEIIVVDDGSTDGTRELLKKIPDIRYFFHEKNRGKGGAVKTGFQKATGDILIIQDADMEYDPNELVDVIKPVIDGKSEVVLGVRIQPEKDLRRHKSLYWISWFGNHVITWFTNILFWNNAGEYEGCYKAFTKKSVDSIDVKTDGFDYENELICKLLKRGYKTVDVPIHYYPRNYEEGKKINWKDGFRILWTILKTRFTD